VDGGLRRVLSVYGHPNNLGLALGRVWPLAAALALAQNKEQNRTSLFFALCSLFCLGGLVVSFSRGAWLGAAVALAVLALGLTSNRRSNVSTARPELVEGFQRSNVRRQWLIGIGLGLAVLVGLALTLRGDVTAGSTPIRLLLWREALGYIRLHPLGIGLDQFGVYHDPQSPLSLIDPALVGTSEQYAAHPHNLLLDIWLRLSPLGLLAFGWLLVRCFRAAWRHIQQPIMLGALAALSAALVHGMVDNFYFVSDLALAFWLLIALVELAQTSPTSAAYNVHI
jgi:putative inorganic carbon (HCO3(-)) transporter